MIESIGNVNYTAMGTSRKKMSAFFPDVFHFELSWEFIWYKRMPIDDEAQLPIRLRLYIHTKNAMEVPAALLNDP